MSIETTRRTALALARRSAVVPMVVTGAYSLSVPVCGRHRRAPFGSGLSTRRAEFHARVNGGVAGGQRLPPSGARRAASGGYLAWRRSNSTTCSRRRRLTGTRVPSRSTHRALSRRVGAILAHAIEVDDRRPMHADESRRIQTAPRATTAIRGSDAAGRAYARRRSSRRPRSSRSPRRRAPVRRSTSARRSVAGRGLRRQPRVGGRREQRRESPRQRRPPPPTASALARAATASANRASRSGFTR